MKRSGNPTDGYCEKLGETLEQRVIWGNAETWRQRSTDNNMAATVTKSMGWKVKLQTLRPETRWVFASCPEPLNRRSKTEITMPSSRFLYRIAGSSRFACFRSRCNVDEVEDSPFEDRTVALCSNYLAWCANLLSLLVTMERFRAYQDKWRPFRYVNDAARGRIWNVRFRK